jgi:hypothetical protein
MNVFADPKDIFQLTKKTHAAKQREILDQMKIPYIPAPDGTPCVAARVLEELAGVKSRTTAQKKLKLDNL